MNSKKGESLERYMERYILYRTHRFDWIPVIIAVSLVSATVIVGSLIWLCFYFKNLGA